MVRGHGSTFLADKNHGEYNLLKDFDLIDVNRLDNILSKYFFIQ